MLATLLAVNEGRFGSGVTDVPDQVKNYSNTRSCAGKMTNTLGTTLFLKNTGHSIHDERPAFFARQIVQFLNPPRQMSVVARTVAMTATTKTIVVQATDPATNQPLNDAVVQIYSVKGKPNTPLTFPKSPPAECIDVVSDEGATDPRGKPIQSGKSHKVNTCLGTVSMSGYVTGTFVP